MTLLTIHNLSIGYNSRAVMRGLDFTVHSGDYLCIIGENGSGKSTLMKTLLSLQPPAGGRIDRGPDFNVHKIGYLPQQTELQKDFPASAGEIVLSGFQGCTGRLPFYTREEKFRADRNMERMGVFSLKRRSFRTLSGGQKQRVLLARALCAASQILFLDEPVTGLDPETAEDMYQLIRTLHQEGLTILMITHDLPAAVRDADHILRIGDEVWFGTKDDYIRGEKDHD